MQADTLLLRLVHPTRLEGDHPSSEAFIPTTKDDGRLSVYDGDLISPPDAYKHFTRTLGLKSAGVWAVTVSEAGALNADVRSDPLPEFAEHAVIDMRRLTKRARRAVAKELSLLAKERGRLAPAPTLR